MNTAAATLDETFSPSAETAAADEIVDRFGIAPSARVPILLALQDRFQYLPEPALRRVCELTSTRPADLAGVVSFYPRFRTRPAGRHRVRVCIGTACHVKGADAIHEAFRQHLDIPPGEDTDAGRLFTLERVACLGCCMLAPAVQIDDVIFGFLTPTRVPGVVRDFLSARDEAGPPTDGGREPATTAAGEVRLCLCSSCAAAGTDAVHRELLAQVRRLGIPVAVKPVGCTGMAYQAPLVDLRLSDGRCFRYGRVRPRDVRDLLLRHFRPTRFGRGVTAAVARLLERLHEGDAAEPPTRFPVDSRSGPDALFVGPQCHLVTEHAGELPPLDLDAYRRHGGFDALETALGDLSPGEIVRRVEAAGLRGRGGAGFPSARKWAAVARAPGERKIVVANGDEGDPGAFMDRMILESFPFRVIEGMAIAARAVGAREGVLYIRAEYPLALERVRRALDLCREHGFLGEDLRGSGHAFDLSVTEGAGAFVCGEETALIAAVEGRRGTPSPRPPYPSESGLWGLPTLVNNVETFALVPWILRNGPEAFSALGTDASKGSKTFALAGKVVRSGLVEVPMGITLRRVVEEIGGGVPEGKRLKAVQVGGPSGGCVPASLADTPVDYEALTATGSIMGSGGMVVLDEDDCMVDIARYFMTFTQRESCGKCTCCRVGTRRMLDILERLCRGEANPADLATLEALAELVRQGSLCGLGRTAPNPVLSTLRHFRDEYEAHVRGECPAGKCRALVSYAITEACIGCTRCAQRCPVGAVTARPWERHAIDDGKCVRCGACRAACRVGAVVRRTKGGP